MKDIGTTSPRHHRIAIDTDGDAPSATSAVSWERSPPAQQARLRSRSSCWCSAPGSAWHQSRPGRREASRRRPSAPRPLSGSRSSDSSPPRSAVTWPADCGRSGPACNRRGVLFATRRMAFSPGLWQRWSAPPSCRLQSAPPSASARKRAALRWLRSARRRRLRGSPQRPTRAATAGPRRRWPGSANSPTRCFAAMRR